ncbi:unnamed protein product [Timema podura]|uniref:Uncharacterized protein n=1 Tax=Timema podura TaxID=61482 RepID=A0ABN7PHH4_TIMPD|nr:unnamed protein product [Timema podura]
MKAFFLVLLASPLVFALPSHKGLRQGPDPEPSPNQDYDLEGYADELLGHVKFDPNNAPLDATVPELSHVFEFKDETVDLEINNGHVTTIEKVERSGEVHHELKGKHALTFDVIYGVSVLTYNYEVRKSDGDVDVEIDGVEATVIVTTYQDTDGVFHGELESIQVGEKSGKITDVVIDDADLPIEIVKEITDTVNTHYTKAEAEAIAAALTEPFVGAVSDIDFGKYAKK